MKKGTLHIGLWALIILFGMSMLAMGHNNRGPIVAWNDGGPVAALAFQFPEPLTVPFPGFEFTVSYVEIQTSGNEFVIIWPSGRFFYTGEYGEGLVFTDAEIDIEIEPGVFAPVEVTIPMLSAQLLEAGKLDEIPPDPLVFDAPDDVDLYFEALLLNPLDLETILEFKMLIRNGELIGIDIAEQTE